MRRRTVLYSCSLPITVVPLLHVAADVIINYDELKRTAQVSGLRRVTTVTMTTAVATTVEFSIDYLPIIAREIALRRPKQSTDDSLCSSKYHWPAARTTNCPLINLRYLRISYIYLPLSRRTFASSPPRLRRRRARHSSSGRRACSPFRSRPIISR